VIGPRPVRAQDAAAVDAVVVVDDERVLETLRPLAGHAGHAVLSAALAVGEDRHFAGHLPVRAADELDVDARLGVVGDGHHFAEDVRVVPEPWLKLAGFTRVPRSYSARQSTRGVPSAAAENGTGRDR